MCALYAAGSIEGDTLVNRDGEDLGTIEHLVLDVPDGRIAYAVVALGGVFGIGAKLFAVPWALLRLDDERSCFVLDMDKARLERAPGFDREHWPAMGDPEWAAQVQDYFRANRE